jgi:hypothetical protein
VWERVSVGGRLPAQRLIEHLGIDGHNYECRLLPEHPKGRAAHLLPGGAVDETAAPVERRAVEAPGGLELGPLRGQQNLVDQHRIILPVAE